MISITTKIKDNDLIQFSDSNSGSPMAIKAVDLKKYFQEIEVKLPDVISIINLKPPVITKSKKK